MKNNNLPEQPLPSYDFIAGIVTTTGNFLWVKQKNSKVPVFQLKMQAKEYELLMLIKNKLELKEKIYNYTHQGRKYCLLLIRSRLTIENKIFPIFDGRLFGQKRIGFDLWKKEYFKNKLSFIYKINSI